MKELTVYLSFVKSSRTTLSLCLLIGAIAGFAFYSKLPTIYTHEQVFEVSSENLSSEERTAVAEEVVGLLRERSVVNSDVQNLHISRIGPFAVKVVLAADNPQTGSEKISYVSQLIKSKGPFIEQGFVFTDVEKPSLFLYSGLGALLGLGLGLCISLMKTYLKQF